MNFSIRQIPRWMCLAACVAALGLAGCASTPGQAPASGAAAGATPGVASVSGSPGVAAVPQIPTGALQPIVASNAASQAAARAVAALATPVDLWARIRRGFAIPDLDNSQVHEREQWYASRPDYMLRMTERSRKFLFHIVEELEVRSMPSELALLPFIESAFNPQAVSSAKAAGMWQFIPSTGKHFDLKQNVFRDDRRDVQASTRAALDYLQKLYGMFGDWQLALAAYNWGEGNVARAIARNQRMGLGTSYSDLNMPAETRMYIPKLQAIKNIVAHPENFNVQLPEIGNHPYFQSVTIRRDMDVAVAAQLAEIRPEDFKALNPSANRPVILAAGSTEILLPWDNAAIFQRNLAAYNGQLASWTAWVVPKTMKPAEAARHAGMSEASFRSVNGVPPNMLIKAGSTLLVPRSASTQEDVAVRVADNGQISLAPEVVLRRTSIKARKADTVASVARRYQLSPSSVAEWNKVAASAHFRPGQTVVVYLAAHKGRTLHTAHGKRGKVVTKYAKRNGKSIKVARR